MSSSRKLLHVGLALACVAELVLFVSLLKAPAPPERQAQVSLEESLEPGEELVARTDLVEPVAPAPVVAQAPALALRLVTARVSVDAAGNIGVSVEPGAWVTRCPEFASPDVLQARSQTSLSEGSGALVVQRTACVSTPAGYDDEVREIPDNSRLLASDAPFEGTVQARAWRFPSHDNRTREVRAAGLFWCPEELEESDTCYAAVSLEVGESSSPLLVPVRLPGRGSSAVSLSPR